MALPAGMGLSAAAEAAGISCQNPAPMPDATAELPAQRAPEVALLGGLLALGRGESSVSSSPAEDAAVNPGLAAVAAAAAAAASASVAAAEASTAAPQDPGSRGRDVGDDERSDPEQMMMMQQPHQPQPH
ncbi:unnamed protein product, partial [Laminaria digitata]